MLDPRRWSTLMSIAGGAAVVLGALDPMEGSVVILPGSALLALASYLNGEDRGVVAFRTSSAMLVAVGVGALFGLSAVGGVGGTSGRSLWWALLILPYPVGWLMDVWSILRRLKRS